MRNGVAMMYAFNQHVTADGRKRVDLVDRYGTIFRSAYVMSGAGMPLNVPLEKEVPFTRYKEYPLVVAGFMQGEPKPVVLGALDNAGVAYSTATDTTTNYDDTAAEPRLTDDADADLPTDVALMEEVALASPRGGRLLLKHNGRVVLAGLGISLQIPQGSYVRISSGGDTGGRIPLVDPLVEILEEMADKINDLQDEVRSLRLQLTTGTLTLLQNLAPIPVTPAVPAPPGALPTVALCVVPGGVYPQQTSFPLVEASTSIPLQPIDPQTVASATLRVSSATEV
jgi:hypothetical protein